MTTVGFVFEGRFQGRNPHFQLMWNGSDIEHWPLRYWTRLDALEGAQKRVAHIKKSSKAFDRPTDGETPTQQLPFIDRTFNCIDL